MVLAVHKFRLNRKWVPFMGAFVYFLFSLNFPTQTLAATKTEITDKDAEIDYYAVLGLNASDQPTVQPTVQQVVTAYRKKIKELHPRSKDGITELKSYDAQLLSDAKTVLSDPRLQAEYMNRVAHRIRRKLNLKVFSAANSDGESFAVPENGSTLSALLGGTVSNSGATHVYNQTYLTQDIEFYRKNHDRNYVAQRASEREDGVPQTFNFKPPFYPKNLEDQWQTWSAQAPHDIKAVQTEFQKIIQWANTTQVKNFGEEYRETEDFLYWWFQQPDSIIYSGIVKKALNHLPEKSPITKALMKASVSESVWRTRDWFQFLLPRTDSYFALAPVMGTREYETEQDLIEAVENLPEASIYSDILMEALIPSPYSVRHPEWIESLLADVTMADFFIKMASNQPLWRKLRPDIFTKAILLLGEKQTERDPIIDRLLTKPDSVHHPEWLAILIKTDTMNGIALKLNQLLALEPWHSSPFLKKLLNGKKLSLANLQEADWSMLKQLPHLQTQPKIEHKTPLRLSCPEVAND